jgi:hypothetical protein
MTDHFLIDFFDMTVCEMDISNSPHIEHWFSSQRPEKNCSMLKYKKMYHKEKKISLSTDT